MASSAPFTQPRMLDSISQHGKLLYPTLTLDQAIPRFAPDRLLYASVVASHSTSEIPNKIREGAPAPRAQS